MELTRELENKNIRETNMNEMNVTVDDMNINLDINANGSEGSEASRPLQQISPHTPQPMGPNHRALAILYFHHKIHHTQRCRLQCLYMRPEILQARQIE